MPSPICYDHMFEDGSSNPEGMAFHYVVGCFSLLSLDIFGHGLVGVFGRKNGLGLYFCSLVPTWWLILYFSPVGSPLLTGGFRSDTTWKTPILVAWLCFLTPYTSLPSAHYNMFSLFSHLGPHFSIGSIRSYPPSPLVHTLG